MSWKDWMIPPAFQQKASQVTKIMVAMFNGEPVFTPKQYDKLAEEGFEKNIWTFRCIMAVAQAVAGVDWVMYSDKTKERELEDHPLLKLLYKPNEFMSKQEFFEAVTAFLLLSGNSFIERNGPNTGPPLELFPLRPDRMKVIPDSKNLVKGYEYKVGSEKYQFDAKKVAHIKLFHATNDLYGLSPIGVAARGIDNDNAATTWNNSLLNNGARPTGAMTTETTLSDPQYTKLKAEMDRQYKGAANAGRPLLLEGGLKWQEMGLSPRDMDFIEIKKISRVEICAAFGVPPEIVGDKEHATYSNYKEARQAFYQDTVLPLMDKVKDKLNSWLVPLYGENLYLDYDKDSIEALQENADEKARRIREDVQAGILMVNEGREARGYDKTKNGDIFYIPGSAKVVTVEGEVLFQPEPPQQQPNQKNNNENDDETNDQQKGLFFFDLKNFSMLENEDSKTRFWNAIEARRNDFFKPVTQKIREQFEREKNAILKAYEATGGMETVENVLAKQQKDWKKLFVSIDLMVIEDFGNAMFNQLKGEAEKLEIKTVGTRSMFKVFSKETQNWISQNVAKKVVGVSDTTKQKIRKIISDGEKEGLGIPEIAKRIDALYLDQIIPNRSQVIARTEIISASNAGNRAAAKQTNLPLEKEWISTRDERTRDTHVVVNGQTRDMDQYYNVGNCELMFPGDPHGKAPSEKELAKEVIQCRCAEGYSVKKGAKKPTATPTAKPLPIMPTLEELENSIKSNPTESGHVFDQSGQLVWSQKGNHNTVIITDAIEKGLLKGNVFTHNHPRGTSFSDADIRVLKYHDVEEIRAVSTNHLYRATLTDKGRKVDFSTFKEEIQNADNQIRKELQPLINSRSITVDHANAIHWHKVWELFQKTTGYLIYKKEEMKK